MIARLRSVRRAIRVAAGGTLLACLTACASLPPRLVAELQPDPPGANHYQKPAGASGEGKSVANR